MQYGRQEMGSVRLLADSKGVSLYLYMREQFHIRYKFSRKDNSEMVIQMLNLALVYGIYYLLHNCDMLL